MIREKVRRKTQAASAGKNKRGPKLRIIGTVAIISVILAIVPFGLKKKSAEGKGIRDHQWSVVRKLPHDPNAFTQGLIFHEGRFFESTGQNGHSSIRRVQPESGLIEQKYDLDPSYFGEGLTFYKGVLIQLTWKAHRAFFYDSSTFEVLREYRYQNEGWGITTDGKNLIMSDGTAVISFRNPDTFEVERTIEVKGHGIQPLQLNELEYINGEIWANVWRTDFVLRIDPETGNTLGRINFKGILTDEDRRGTEDVLNGIAYNPASNEIFITGKYYPYIYQVAVKDLP